MMIMSRAKGQTFIAGYKHAATNERDLEAAAVPDDNSDKTYLLVV